MNIYWIKKISQNIPNLDTLERVWQSLFKVYNQTLRKMGDNDFSVEHTGVRVRQMAGTLEWVVKYDAVAFQKAWTFWRPATTRTTFFFLFFFLFRRIIFPGKGENMAFFGATVFFAAVGPCRVMSLEKKKKVSTKKTSKISKKSSPRASDTGKGSYKHNVPNLWGRGSIFFSVLACFLRGDFYVTNSAYIALMYIALIYIYVCITLGKKVLLISTSLVW